jgi:hypothetical protein
MQEGENSETEGGSARKRAALEGVAGLISPQGDGDSRSEASSRAGF